MFIRKGMVPLLLLLGTLGYTHIAKASCERDESVPTVRVDMDVGRVVISPDSRVGDVLLKRVYTSTSTGGINYRCSPSANVTFIAKLVNPGKDLGNNVYATNVKGVGIRFSRGGSTVNIVYPGSFTTHGSSFSLEGSKFTMELIKTEETTGSGPIVAGKYTSYGAPDGSSPLLETYINANGVTIVSPSCKLISDKVMNVTMPDVAITGFKGTGTKVGNKDFSIDLLCNGGVSVAGYANVNTSFSGETPNGYAKSSGVLVNENEEGISATGIGFQVKSKGNPIAFDEKYVIGRLEDGIERRLSFPMSVSYYQYGKTASAGRVASHMVYNIFYD